MNNAALILDIQHKYDTSEWEVILCNFRTAINIGKHNGYAVDRYVTLPKITDRSKHTVISWFNRNRKIPLIDICKIAKYLNLNVYTFLDNEMFKDADSFLKANETYDRINTNGADIYIRAYDMQYNTDKDIILDNLEEYFGTPDDIVHNKSKDRLKCIEICGCTKNTYHAWFNRSRTNVKIPVIMLCKIALYLGVDIFDLMTYHERDSDE